MNYLAFCSVHSFFLYTFFLFLFLFLPCARIPHITELFPQDVVVFDVLAVALERDEADQEAFRRVLPLHPPRPVHLLRQGGPRGLLQGVADRLQVGVFVYSCPDVNDHSLKQLEFFFSLP